MRVHLLGTGTLEPQAQRASTSLAVESESEIVYIDFGRNALSRAVECGLDPLSAGMLLLTHLHPDHCCELVSLFFARNYHRRVSGEVRFPLRIVGPPGTRVLVEAIGRAWRWCEARFDLQIDEVGAGWQERVGRMKLFAHPMSHGDDLALGYRVEVDGASMAFTGDTGPGPGVVELARGVDLLIAECGHRDGDDRRNHMSESDLIDLIRSSEPARVVLTHFYPEVDRLGVSGRIGAETGCEVSLGEDRRALDVG